MRSYLLIVILSLAIEPVARAQNEPVSPRLQGLLPVGGRSTVTESWGTLGFTLENLGSTAREARVVVFYPKERDVQYGRDVWVPANSRITSWIPVGPAPDFASETRRDFKYMLFDRSDGELHPLTPTDPERIPSRAVPYRKREPTTAVLVDAVAAGPDEPDPLASPDSPDARSIVLVRTFREARGLSENVSVILEPELPPTPQALEGIDHLVLAGNRLAADPAGREVIRHWVLHGGTLWVLLDRVNPEVIAPILGDAERFRVIDHTSLTTVRLRAAADEPERAESREFDQPVDMVRVSLSGAETLHFEANGWPAAFSQQLGRGRIVFTTLGGRAWYRDRTPRDPPSRSEKYRDLPVPLTALDSLAWQIHPDAQPVAFQTEDLGPLLTAEIGYKVLGRKSAAVILAGFVLVLVALGLVLRRSRSPELIGLLGPAAAVAAAGVFIVTGMASRRAVPSTAAAAALVEFSPETGEAAARGMFAVYNPESGTIRLGAENGGAVELDQSGLEGQTRKRIQTDLDAWHWEDLAFPAGVRLGPFRSTIRDRASATGRFSAEGLVGQLEPGAFRNPGDAVVLTRSGAVLAPRLEANGSFLVPPASALPDDQYLEGPVLTDRQQRRQSIYRELLSRPRPPHLEGRDLLLVWTDAEQVPFSSGNRDRQFASALLVVPLQIGRSTGEDSLRIPGGFCSFTAVTEGRSHRPTLDGTIAVRNRLRFQLPVSVMPLTLQEAALVVRVRAPGRKLIVSGHADGQTIALREALNPLGTIRVEIQDPRLLQLDPTGGLFLDVAVSGRIGPDGQGVTSELSEPDAKWVIEDLSLEVTGRVSGR